MIGIVVPAHDEEHLLPGCLQALCGTARHLTRQSGEPVALVVVADACRDATPAIARRFGASVCEVDHRNVGRARATGADEALRQGCRWLAFTDADTVVAPDWLAAQLALQADAVCGTVAIRDWSQQPVQSRIRFRSSYVDRDGHRHVHGANLGVRARAYHAVGGFPPVANHEDVGLVARLRAAGCSIAWSASPRVYTSARRDHRCTAGFGATLATATAATGEPGRRRADVAVVR